MASGVLVMCMGRGTKLVEKIMDQPKVYATTARLDVTSETLDAEVSGTGAVKYIGDPEVTQKVSGMGSIRKLQET